MDEQSDCKDRCSGKRILTRYGIHRVGGRQAEGGVGAEDEPLDGRGDAGRVPVNGQDARSPGKDDIGKSLSFFAADRNAILMSVCTNRKHGSDEHRKSNGMRQKETKR